MTTKAPALRAVYVRCLKCLHSVPVPIRDREMIVPICSCDGTLIELSGQLSGLIASDGVMLQKATAQDNVYLAKTALFAMLGDVLDRLRIKNAGGEFFTDRCLLCEGEPHTETRVCQCICHSARALQLTIRKSPTASSMSTHG